MQSGISETSEALPQFAANLPQIDAANGGK
jgi:hypothetical protein